MPLAPLPLGLAFFLFWAPLASESLSTYSFLAVLIAGLPQIHIPAPLGLHFFHLFFSEWALEAMLGHLAALALFPPTRHIGIVAALHVVCGIRTLLRLRRRDNSVKEQVAKLLIKMWSPPSGAPWPSTSTTISSEDIHRYWQETWRALSRSGWTWVAPLQKFAPWTAAPPFFEGVERISIDPREDPATEAAYGLHAGCRIEVLRPRRRAGHQALPVLVFVHGGGWSNGSEASHEFSAAAWLLARQGWCVVSLAYRLSNGKPQYWRHGHPTAARWPDHRNDVIRGLWWATDQVGRYGGDAEAMFIAGSSAGGHLVSVAALTIARDRAAAASGLQDDRERSAAGGDPPWHRTPQGREVVLHGCVSMYGVMDPFDEGQHHVRIPAGAARLAFGPNLGRAPQSSTTSSAARPDEATVSMLDCFFSACVMRRGHGDDERESASPVALVQRLLREQRDGEAAAVQGPVVVPPFLIVNGTVDSLVPIEASQDFLAHLGSLRRQRASNDDGDTGDGDEQDSPDGLLSVPATTHNCEGVLNASGCDQFSLVCSWLTLRVAAVRPEALGALSFDSCR